MDLSRFIAGPPAMTSANHQSDSVILVRPSPVADQNISQCYMALKALL